jgi:hypothetical protein
MLTASDTESEPSVEPLTPASADIASGTEDEIVSSLDPTRNAQASFPGQPDELPTAYSSAASTMDTEQSVADFPARFANETINRRKREKKRRYSHHSCPHCGQETLERKRLSRLIRPFRLLPGLHPRAYVCASCKKHMVLWRPDRTHHSSHVTSSGGEKREPPSD